MLPSRFILRGICFLVLVSCVMSKCKAPTPLNHTIVRTTAIPSGEALFSFFAPNANVLFTVKTIATSSSLDNNHFFAMRRTGQFLELFIKKPSELTSFIKPYIGKPCGLGLKVAFTCRDIVDSSTLTFKRNLYIRSPDATINVNLTLQKFYIREDAQVLDKVVNLMVLVLNPKSSIVMSRFVAQPFIDLVGNAMSIVKVAEDGNVFLKRALDREKGDVLYSLNITLMMSLFVCTGESNIVHGSIQTIDRTVQFQIINVNDKPPRFIFPGCPPTCGPAHYSTSVGIKFTGDLTSIDNGPINATDGDGDVIQYSFQGGSPTLYDLYFSINDQTGLVSMVRPMNDDDMIVMTLIILSSWRQLQYNVLYSTDGKYFDYRPTVCYYKMYAPSVVGREPELYCLARGMWADVSRGVLVTGNHHKGAAAQDAQSVSVLPETVMTRPKNKVYTFLLVWMKGKEKVYLSARFLLGSSSGANSSLPRPNSVLGTILMIVVVLIM